MRRMIFRFGRERVIPFFMDADFKEEDLPSTREAQKIFVVLCPNVNYLIRKILQTCDLYSCVRFEPPKEKSGVVLGGIERKIEEQRHYLSEVKGSLKQSITQHFSNLNLHKLYFKKQKLVFFNLSKCLFRENFIDGEVWVLKEKFEKIRQELSDSDNEFKTAFFMDIKNYGMRKPTKIRTNKFTEAFQEIVNFL